MQVGIVPYIPSSEETDFVIVNKPNPLCDEGHFVEECRPSSASVFNFVPKQISLEISPLKQFPTAANVSRLSFVFLNKTCGSSPIFGRNVCTCDGMKGC